MHCLSRLPVHCVVRKRNHVKLCRLKMRQQVAMFGTDRAGAVRELRRGVGLDMKLCLAVTAAAR